MSLVSYTRNGQYFYTSLNKYYGTTPEKYNNTSTRYQDAQIYISEMTIGDNTYITFSYSLLFPQGNIDTLTNYYRNYNVYTISDALVTGDITINLDSGANIIGDVYGGGNNGAVNGNITINVEDGATITGNIYGGGAGLSATISSTMSSTFNVIWTNSTDDYVITVSDFESKAYEAGTVFSNAPDDGNYTTPFLIGSELISSYQQSDGYMYIYSETINKLGLITGNTEINISGGTIDGSVYGGSNGSVASVSGDTCLNITGGTIQGSVYGGGNAGTVANTTTNISNATITGDIYGGGNTADISGYATLNITNSTANNIYGGGNVGEITGTVSGTTLSAFSGVSSITDSDKFSTVITIDGGTYNNIYGGGNEGDVTGNTFISISSVDEVADVFGGGNYGNVGSYDDSIYSDCYVIIYSGTFDNVFGGSDQGVVSGDIYVSVGQTGTSAPTTTVNEIVYGGGKGVADSNGDASGFTTAYGNSTVIIQGINTSVENYGSVKLRRSCRKYQCYILILLVWK